MMPTKEINCYWFTQYHLSTIIVCITKLFGRNGYNLTSAGSQISILTFSIFPQRLIGLTHRPTHVTRHLVCCIVPLPRVAIRHHPITPATRGPSHYLINSFGRIACAGRVAIVAMAVADLYNDTRYVSVASHERDGKLIHRFDYNYHDYDRRKSN